MNAEHGEGWSIYQCPYADLAAIMRGAGVKADALIADPPYSERTHKGHGSGAATANRIRPEDAKRLRVDSRNGAVYEVGEHRRRSIDYDPWTEHDVGTFAADLAAVVGGWWGVSTDHHSAPVWDRALTSIGLYTFAPLPCVESGATVRMVGDGPPSWTTRLVTAAPEDAEVEDATSDLVLARPSEPTYRRWAVRVDREKRGARPLPGYYLGKRERKPIVGGKPLWLMREIVGDYSAPGALVLDPCAGGGTTLVAAIQIGRRAIGCEPDAGRFAIAVERLRAAEKEKTTP